MLKSLFILGALLLGLTANAQTPKYRPLTSAPFTNVLYISQDIELNGQATTRAQVSPLTGSSAGFGATRMVTPVTTYEVGLLPRVPLGNPVAQADALFEMERWMNITASQYAKNVGVYLKSKRISSAVISFTQEFMITTTIGSKKKSVAWNASIDSSGRATYGKPKIIDSDPVYVMAVYYPLNATDGLPTNWAALFPNAGTLRYQVLNKRFEPITSWATLATGGAYDSDSSGSDKVKCLMDLRNSGCSGPVDIRTLMDQVGASAAFVDYVRQLEPQYETDPVSGDSIAVGAISYDARILSCTTLKNQGFFGYVLSLTAERYMATPNPSLVSYQVIEQYTGKTLSPVEGFSKELKLSELYGRNPDQFLISPHPGDQVLLDRNDKANLKNIIYLAPLTTGADEVGMLNPHSYQSDMAVTELSSVGKVREYYVGTIGNDYWKTGIYDRSIMFNLQSPKTAKEFAIIQEGFDDWMLVRVNGYLVYIGPYGGDMLEVQTGANSIVVPPWERCFRDDWDVTTWSCWTDEQVQTRYKWCTPIGNDENYQGYRCGNGCAPGMVQYWSNGNGCGYPELSKSWLFNTYVDLRPYLVTGDNLIQFRVIVAGGGEGWVRLRTEACDVSMYGAIDGDPPPVPAGAGSGGVFGNISGKL